MNELTTNITSLYNTLPDSFKSLNEEQLKQVILASKMDDYKSQINSHIRNSKFDLDSVLSDFLSKKTHNTARSYELHINEFRGYANGKSFLDVDYKFVDGYIDNILNTYSLGKAQLALASLSSFYSVLVRYGHISRNPFLGAKLSIKKDDEDKYIPSDEDIKNILNSYNSYSKADKKMSLAIYLMVKYGLRVGFFNKESIKYDGKFLSSISKGKVYKINVEDDTYVIENSELLKELNSNSIQSSWNRTVGKMCKDGELQYKFSPHSIRHKFACKIYNESKDIYRVSRMLHHSNILVTQNYLRGLNLDIKMEVESD